MRILLLSGLSGSGKSTFAVTDAVGEDEKVVVCSADDYFMRSGEYSFDPSKLGEAHASCMRKFCDTLTHRIGIFAFDVLIVDNTNTTVVELAPYVSVANAFGYKPTFMTIWCDPIVAHKRNAHGVPIGTIMRMQANLQARAIPPFWNVTVESHYGAAQT